MGARLAGEQAAARGRHREAYCQAGPRTNGPCARPHPWVAPGSADRRPMMFSEVPHSGPDRPAPPSEFLTQSEVARRYKLSERTVERWRLTGEGPPFVRIGPRRVLYRLVDCEAWLAER